MLKGGETSKHLSLGLTPIHHNFLLFWTFTDSYYPYICWLCCPLNHIQLFVILQVSFHHAVWCTASVNNCLKLCPVIEPMCSLMARTCLAADYCKHRSFSSEFNCITWLGLSAPALPCLSPLLSVRYKAAFTNIMDWKCSFLLSTFLRV